MTVIATFLGVRIDTYSLTNRPPDPGILSAAGSPPPAQLRAGVQTARLWACGDAPRPPYGQPRPLTDPPAVAGVLAGHRTRDTALGAPSDPPGHHLPSRSLSDTSGDLLPVCVGQHPALAAHPALLVDGVVVDLHQDLLLRPAAIKGRGARPHPATRANHEGIGHHFHGLSSNYRSSCSPATSDEVDREDFYVCGTIVADQ